MKHEESSPTPGKASLSKASLPQRLAEQLRQDIAAGVWQDQLPGRRILAIRYDVSAKTCTKALEILEHKGILTPFRKGKPRAIIQHARTAGTGKSQRNLLIIQPSMTPLSADDHELIYELQLAWEAKAGVVSRVSLDYQWLGEAHKRLQTLTQRHSTDAILSFMPPLKLARAIAQSHPSFQLGGHHVGKHPTSHFGLNLRQELECTARQLIAWGHRRILIPHSSPDLHRYVLQALKSAYNKKENTPAELEAFCPLFTNPHPEALLKFWEETLSQLQPSVVILTDETQFLSLFGFCQRAGIKIPRDLSIVLLAHNPKYTWLSPRPAMALFPNAEVVRHFKQWIQSGYQPLGKHHLPLHYDWGESVSRITSE